MNQPETQAPKILGSQEEAAELFGKLVEALRRHRDDEAGNGRLSADGYFRLPEGATLGEFAQGVCNLERSQAFALSEWVLGSKAVDRKPSIARGGAFFWVSDPEDDTPSQPEAARLELEEQRRQIGTYHALVRTLMNTFVFDHDAVWLRDNLPPDQLEIVERILEGDASDDDA